MRLARWAGPEVRARAPPTAHRERDRVSAPATATEVSSLVRPPIRGPPRPLPITRVSLRPAKSAGTCAPRQGGIGPTRGGGHRQSRGSKASRSGRRGESAVGARADPSAPDTPPADGDDGAEEAASRPRRAMSQHLDANSPVAYAPLGGVAPPAIGVAGDRPIDRLGQIAGGGAADEGLALAQDEPLLAPRPANDIGDSQRRGGSDDETMPPADPRASSPAPVGDVSMTGFGGDGDTPVPAGDATPPDAPMPDGSGGATPPRRLHARWVRWCWRLCRFAAARACCPSGWGGCGSEEEGAMPPGT